MAENIVPEQEIISESAPATEPANTTETAPNNKRKLGAALPEWLANQDDSDEEGPDRKRRKLNETEPAKQQDDEEDVFGPRPALANMFQADETSEESEDSKRKRRELEDQQWAVLRGTQSAAASLRTGPAKREDWMTKLPETKKISLDFDLMQKSVTSFSRKGVDDRGDASGWTSTPGEEPVAPQKSALELAKQMVAERVAAEKERQSREAIEKYNTNRQKSLMEQHHEAKLEKKEKKKDPKDKKNKKDKKEKKGKKDKDKKHKDKDKKHKDKKDKKKKDEKEYVPYFDRDRDLQVGVIDSKRTAKLLSENNALLSRFGTSNSNKFL